MGTNGIDILKERARKSYGGILSNMLKDSPLLFENLYGVIDSVKHTFTEINDADRQELIVNVVAKIYKHLTSSEFHRADALPDEERQFFNFSIFNEDSQHFEEVFEACLFSALCLFIDESRKITRLTYSEFLNKHSLHGYSLESEINSLKQVMHKKLLRRLSYFKGTWPAISKSMEHYLSAHYTLLLHDAKRDCDEEKLAAVYKKYLALFNNIDKLSSTPRNARYEDEFNDKFDKFYKKLHGLKFGEYKELCKYFMKKAREDKQYYGINLYRNERRFMFGRIMQEVGNMLKCGANVDKSLLTFYSLTSIPFPSLYRCFSENVHSREERTNLVETCNNFVAVVSASVLLAFDVLIEGTNIEGGWENAFLSAINAYADKLFPEMDEIEYQINDESEDRFRLLLISTQYGLVLERLRSKGLLSPASSNDADKNRAQTDVKLEQLNTDFLFHEIEIAVDKIESKIKDCFIDSRGIERALQYMFGLITTDGRKNKWHMSLFSDEKLLNAMQQFINKGRWDANKLMGYVREYIKEELGDNNGVIVINELCFEKKGDNSVGVAKQKNVLTGKGENCQIGIFLTYISGKDFAIVDRELYLPGEWIDNKERCDKVGVPTDFSYTSKPKIAFEMLKRSHKSQMPFSWVAADSPYGDPVGLRNKLEKAGMQYVYAISDAVYVQRKNKQYRIAELLDNFPGEDWERYRAEHGFVDGNFDWFYLNIDTPLRDGYFRLLLVRRNKNNESTLKVFLCHFRGEAQIEELIEISKMKYQSDALLEKSKAEIGLSHYETRKYHGWYKHITLACMARSFTAVLKKSWTDEPRGI